MMKLNQLNRPIEMINLKSELNDNINNLQIKYCIIIASYNPNKEILFDTLKILSKYDKLRTYIVDCSSDETTNELLIFIQKLNKSYKNQNLFLLHINTNLGVGHNYNVGIKKCLNDGCDLITLFTDDVTINENKFPAR
ncbi:MAG: glycosyltransferase [Nitrososphaeria archaeon]